MRPTFHSWCDMVQLSDSSLPSPKASSLPLATIMQSTAEHIQAVLAGASLTKCLAQTPSAQYAAVQAHDFYAMRQLGWEIGRASCRVRELMALACRKGT